MAPAPRRPAPPSTRKAAAKQTGAPGSTGQAAPSRKPAELRQEQVLDAARSAFFELGMEKASLREIARRAGYTPGALYSYFPSKEHIYAALLGESLQRLNIAVDLALGADQRADEQLRAAATAFFDFYRLNPHDLDLGFYLFQGMAPRGLTPELDRALNAKLRGALLPCHGALRAMGLADAQATQEVTALFAHIVGLLVMSHTGRIRMFGQSSQTLFGAYLDQLVERAA